MIMREILFRGKFDNGNGMMCWIEGDLIHYSDDEVYIMDQNYRLWDIQHDGVRINDLNTIGQYIGLKDKNGTKIFEGDILYTKHGVKCEGKGYYETYNEVVFKNGAFGVIGETTGDFLSFDYLPLDNEVVCGNIYENEELLK